MDKKLYLLSDGGDPMDARFMTEDEAHAAQRKAEGATDGTFIWYGPFDVSGPYAKEPWKVSSAKAKGPKAADVEVTEADRAKYRSYTDGSIQGKKFIKALPSDRLLAAAKFSPDGNFDFHNAAFLEIFACFDADTNISWVSGNIAEELYNRDEIDTETFDRMYN